MCQPLSWPQMEHAIRRNFGGLESEEINPLEEFRKAIGYVEDCQDFTGPNDEVLQPAFLNSCAFFFVELVKLPFFPSADDVDKEP